MNLRRFKLTDIRIRTKPFTIDEIITLSSEGLLNDDDTGQVRLEAVIQVSIRKLLEGPDMLHRYISTQISGSPSRLRDIKYRVVSLADKWNDTPGDILLMRCSGDVKGWLGDNDVDLNNRCETMLVDISSRLARILGKVRQLDPCGPHRNSSSLVMDTKDIHAAILEVERYLELPEVDEDICTPNQRTS